MSYYKGAGALFILEKHMPKDEYCPCCGAYLTSNPYTKVIDKNKYRASEEDTFNRPNDIEVDEVCVQCAAEIHKRYVSTVVDRTERSRQKKSDVDHYEYWSEFNEMVPSYNYEEVITRKTIYGFDLIGANIVIRENGLNLEYVYLLDERRWVTPKERIEIEEQKERERNAAEYLEIQKRRKEEKEKNEKLLVDAYELIGREYNLKYQNSYIDTRINLVKLDKRQYPEAILLLKKYNDVVERVYHDLKIKRIKKMCAVIGVIAIVFGVILIKNVIPHENIVEAQVNTEYTGEIKGAKCDDYYKFTIDKPGIVFPETDNLGGIASRCNIMIFKDDESKDILYYNYVKNGADAVYLEKGDYYAVLNSNTALDYSHKGYTFSLGFKAKNKTKATKNLKEDVVYTDALKNADSVKEYVFLGDGNYTAVILTEQPFGVCDGDVGIFKQDSRYTQNTQKYFKISKGENSSNVNSIDVTDSAEINFHARKDEPIVFNVSAGENYASQPYILYIYKD